MQEIEFYDVVERKKVKLSLKEIKKTTYERKLKNGDIQTRYAFRGSYNSRTLTKFCSQSAWEQANVEVEK